jgi:hypothetical protein
VKINGWLAMTNRMFLQLLTEQGQPTPIARLFARGLSFVLVGLLLVMLNQSREFKLLFAPDNQIANITLVKTREIEIPKPKILPSQKLPIPKPAKLAMPPPNIKDRLPKNLNLPSVSATTAVAPIPRIVTNASAPTAANTAPYVAPQTPANSGLRRALWLQACERIDVAERPADCPVTDRARRAVAAASEPKYNPDNVRSYSRAEINAKKMAGWRDRCETNEGRRAQVCIAIGRTPTQVKTPYEICMEHGLSNCRPPPSKYDDPILGFGNQQ